MNDISKVKVGLGVDGSMILFIYLGINVVFHFKEDLTTGNYYYYYSELTWFFATKTVSPRGSGG